MCVDLMHLDFFPWCPLSPRAFIVFPPPLSQGSLSPGGQSLMEPSHSELSDQGLPLCTLPVGLILFPLTAEGRFSYDHCPEP